MADEVDDAIFSVSAFDNFSDTLDDLEENLRDIETTVQAVDPIDIDSQVADALADIEAVRAGVASLDDDKTIDIDVDSDNIPDGMSDLIDDDRRGRSIDPVDVNDLAGDLLTDLESIGTGINLSEDQRELTDLGNVARDATGKFDTATPDVEAQTKDALADIETLALATSKLDDEDVNIDVEADLAEAFAEIQEVRAAARDEDLDIDTDAHVASAIAKINSVRAALASVDSHKTVDIDIDDDSSLFGAATEEWHEKQIFGDTTADPAEMWDMFNYFDRSQARQTPTGGTFLSDTLAQSDENPFRGTDRERDINIEGPANFRAAPGLLAEGPADDVAVDLVQAQSEAADIFDREEERDEGMTPGERLREAFKDFKQLRLSMGMFMNLMASLLPILGVFAGALPAAIAGVAALGAAALAAAAAMYGIAGLGVMALAMEGGEWDFQALKEDVQGLIRTFMDAFGPLANAIEPMMLDLMGNVQMAMFGVAQHMRPLLDLTDEARGAFNTLLGLVGPFAEDTIRFAEAVMPVFEMLGDIGMNIDMYAVLGDILAKTLPLLAGIASMIGNALPMIYDISLGFLAVATAVTYLITGFLRLIDIVPFAGQLLGYLTGITLSLLTATALYSLATGTLVSRLGALVVAAGKYVAAMITKIWVTYGATAAVGALVASLTVLLGILSLGIIPIIGGVSSQFSVLGSDIKDATGSLRAFNKEAGRVSDISPGMDGPRYTQPTAAGSSSGSGFGSGTSGSTYTVVAPDQETGTSVANTMDFVNSGSDEEGDVNNRLHGT